MNKWRAACIQMRSDLAALAPDRRSAWQTIDGNLARAVKLIDRACAEPASKPHLVVLPEFAMQGPPHGASIAQWIENACATIPGPITGPLQELARRQAIFIAHRLAEAIAYREAIRRIVRSRAKVSAALRTCVPELLRGTHAFPRRGIDRRHPS